MVEIPLSFLNHKFWVDYLANKLKVKQAVSGQNHKPLLLNISIKGMIY